VYNDELTAPKWALNSAVECHLHTVEVIGSNPIAPTIYLIEFAALLMAVLPSVCPTRHHLRQIFDCGALMAGYR
jgi:hypothetical protein